MFSQVIFKKVIFAVVTHLDLWRAFVELVIIQKPIVDSLLAFKTLVGPGVTISMVAAVDELFITQWVGTVREELALELDLVKVVKAKPSPFVSDFSPMTVESLLVPISAICCLFFVSSHEAGASANHLLVPGLVALLVLGVALRANQVSTLDTWQTCHVIHDVAADLATDFIYDILLLISRVGAFPVKADLGFWNGYQVLLIKTFCQRLELLLNLTILFHSEFGMRISKF